MLFHRNTHLVQINSLLKPESQETSMEWNTWQRCLYKTGETTTVQGPSNYLTLVSTFASLPLVEEQWRPCRPSFSQSRCAGSSWRKAEWTATGTLLGPQTNTWTQEKSRKVTSKLRHWESSSSSHHTLQTSSIYVFMSWGHLEIKRVLTDLIVLSLIRS